METAFDGRKPSMGDNIQWRMVYNGRQPSLKDKFDGSQPLMVDTLAERHPLVEKDLG